MLFEYIKRICVNLFEDFLLFSHEILCLNLVCMCIILLEFPSFSAGADLNRCIRCECIGQISQSIYKITMILISF